MNNIMTFPKLFVTDLDSTALGGDFEPYTRFPDPFSEFLDKLADHHCQWAINTTWDAAGQLQVVLDSAVRSRPSFLMAEIGTRLARVIEDSLEFVQPYTSDTERQVRQVCSEHLFPIIKDLGGRFIPKQVHFYGHWYDFLPLEDQADQFVQYIEEHYAANNSLHHWVGEDKRFIAHPSFIDKGRNLAEVLRITGLEPQQVVIAGDNVMDTKMMTPDLAGHCVCPENATDVTKQHVVAMGGEIGEGFASIGVIDAFNKLAARHGWDF